MSDEEKQLPAKIILEGEVMRSVKDLQITIVVRNNEAFKTQMEAFKAQRPKVREVYGWEGKDNENCIDGECES